MDSIWQYSHPEKLEFLDKKKNIYNIVLSGNEADESGKVNFCINTKLQKKDEAQNIPLSKFLIDNSYIRNDGHYYIVLDEKKRYSVFYKNGIVFPFSDRICSESLVDSLKDIFDISSTEVIELKKHDLNMTNKKEISIHLNTALKILFGFFTLSCLLSLTYFYM
ncbi:hypothetical protein [Vibrio aestuarianus]|uniref:Uncharacterized protein n=1 Tax=Vibrio aestuarianus TaxID=28171 RepID=A0A9X4EY43_9VIBR|nr:hypothetical protein [Vibrio aestuarianus]MDE1240604.1 hypothetical protein [Vibrio aestuarianus]MDE1262743.1 hypothetical protein [Vibrio aestuarianus]MDE1295120.1 hypothetical protein [Vibrio aestuarianus]MDE1334800.1 hypothetical protein [Vibrio aestuarianus]